MKKSKFTEEQIAFALRQAESGTRVAEVWRKIGIFEQTYFMHSDFPSVALQVNKTFLFIKIWARDAFRFPH